MKVKPPTYNPRPPILWSYIFAAASFGVLLGVALLLGWLRIWLTAPIGWLVLTAAWIWMVDHRELGRAFFHVFMIVTIGSFFAGVVPLLFHETYLANNPDVKEILGSTVSTFDKLKVLLTSLGYGLAFGALGGFVGDRLAMRRSPPPVEA